MKCVGRTAISGFPVAELSPSGINEQFPKNLLSEGASLFLFSPLLFYFVFGGRAITIIFLKFVFIWAWNRYIIADSLLWVTQRERITGACSFKRFVWKSWWKCYNHFKHVLFCFQKILSEESKSIHLISCFLMPLCRVD